MIEENCLDETNNFTHQKIKNIIRISILHSKINQKYYSPTLMTVLSKFYWESFIVLVS